MHVTRTAAAGATVAALLLTLAPGAVAAPTRTPAAPLDAPEVSVSELDLTGVARSELAALPADPPLPEDSTPIDEPTAGTVPSAWRAGGAAAVRGASVATPDPEASPTPVATPVPTAGSSPTSVPEPTTVPAPTDTPAPSTGATPTSPADEPMPTPDVLTGPLPTEPFTVLGLSWDNGATGVVVRYRVRTGETWSPWEAVGASDVAPDDGSADADAGASSRVASDAVVALGADGLQVWAEAEDGQVTGLKAVLIDPGHTPADERVDTPPSSARGTAGDLGDAVFRTTALTTAQPATVVAASYPVPAIVRRSGWGADESLATCKPDVSPSNVAAVVHHTASTNSYSAADVPGLLRGIFAYHTRPESAGGRGWCDIGYNFLVDRFGRIFEGRAGSMDQTVVGVHTGGFNSRTVGVSAIGEFGASGAPVEMLEAISRTIAWKFAQLRTSGSGTVALVSGGGATFYPAGTTVVLPTIFGHRDAQQTSCPGQNLYNALPAIRARVSQLVDAGVAASPFGNWERTTVSPEAVEVAGWVHDPDTRGPVRLVVDVDGRRTEVVADRARPDVAAAHPTAGPAHGFTVRVPLARGRNVVCLWAVNVAGGYDTTLGCRDLTGTNAPPVGSIDELSATSDTLTVRGWALDPDTRDPIDVHIYVNGVGRVVRADLSRPDVDVAYGRGDRHGFSLQLPVAGGTHQVCVYAINTPAGANTTLACTTVVAQNPPPLGRVDEVTTTSGSVTVRGWAFDPDTTEPIDVHVYLDGVGRSVRADARRGDIAAAFGRGDRHGFEVTLPAAPGQHQLCVYGINTPAGPNTTLGCRTVSVVDAAPLGNLEAVVGGAGRVSVSGWAFDPDTTQSIDVHVYVDGVGRAVRADLPRTDVGAAYRRGDRHGFSTSVPAARGSHRVCVYAIGVPAGNNPALGCATVTAS
ncbi:N-acetylmuramoyl-L-alanine amidase [Cellulomonas sp. NPDC057328]|uniref:N-acetylmuramoyl-L-alanine amidase n=1 Tax=Cellulomonas sp. NPDC057328 TaxID=3346101 RepID=UPI00363CDA87